MKRIIITEEQLNRLVLTEKLGISEEVIFAAESLKRELKRYIDGVLNNTQERLEVIEGQLPFRTFYTTYTVIFTVYLIPTDVSLFQEIDLDNNTIRLAFTYINNTFDSREFDDGITHELTHAFQKYKKGGSVVSNKKYCDEYVKAIDILQHPNSEGVTVELFDIAKTIYLLKNFEQDAYFHGVYSQIKNQLGQMDDFDENYIEDLVINSDLYGIINFLKRVVRNMAKKNIK